MKVCITYHNPSREMVRRFETCHLSRDKQNCTHRETSGEEATHVAMLETLDHLAPRSYRSLFCSGAAERRQIHSPRYGWIFTCRHAGLAVSILAWAVKMNGARDFLSPMTRSRVETLGAEMRRSPMSEDTRTLFFSIVIIITILSANLHTFSKPSPTDPLQRVHPSPNLLSTCTSGTILYHIKMCRKGTCPTCRPSRYTTASVLPPS